IRDATVTGVQTCALPISDGATPAAALIQATDGKFYGTTKGGGAAGSGVVFRLAVGVPAAPTGLTAAAATGHVNLRWLLSASAAKIGRASCGKERRQRVSR